MRCRENIFYDNNNHAIIKSFHSTADVGERGYREHHHTECELSLCISGRGHYMAQGVVYEFECGDMFLFGSNEAHCITDISEPLDLLNVHFEPKLLWEQAENIALLNIFSARNENFSNKYSRTDTALQEFIVQIERELETKNQGYATMLRYNLLSALVHIMRNYDYIDKDKTITNTAATADCMKNAMDYINGNLGNKLSLGDIAAKAGMTQTYFSAVFKKFNGISPWDYIIIKRVEMAIEMLKNTNLTKLEIAERCGFSSSSNFYKAFGRITGKKPSDFGKNQKKF